ncbi:MAG: UDP-N-acetylmuramate dehydrogenase [Candidatus Omnitrophica bacterium]|nr:UDP-N-acetylmuramate dehydrogenase [Candidatus Omnitrophota bacterium]
MPPADQSKDAAAFIPPAGIPLLPERQLSRYTTFQLGGPARGVLSCRTPAELRQAVLALTSQGCPFILIGGGSNLVVSDQGLECYVIRYFSEEPVLRLEEDVLTVSGSTRLDDAVAYAACHGYEGLNYASGIPGTVGGAVVGNAGAFGRQVGDVLSSALLIHPDGTQRRVGAQELDFQYRHSALKESREIVAEAAFALRSADAAGLQKERAEILKIRAGKHPDLSQNPCAGSFFRNIEPTSQAGRRQAAGWFLDQAGGKALSYGGAAIYPKHANIIVKGPDCKAQDVYELSRMMARLAKDHFNLDLVREVRFVGDFDGAEPSEHTLIW